MKFKSLVKSLALTTGLVASFSSYADFKDFTVDETPYGGDVITVDKLNGGYQEVIEFDGSGGFVTSAFASFGQLYRNEGGDVALDSVIGSGYRLYAIFTAQGTVSTPGDGGSLFSFSADSGAFTLYMDRNNDTSYDDIAAGTVLNDSDDLELGYSTNIGRNSGLMYPVGGFFDFLFDDFTLTADGDTYFVDPSPFHLMVNVDGDFDQFEPIGTQNLTGDLSAAFVPEPSTLAVLALGLMGLGMTGRRKFK